VSDSAPKKRALGRGLSALLGAVDAPTGETPSQEENNANTSGRAGDRVSLAALAQIQPNPKQPRTHFQPETLAELAESIRQHGILQPLIVTRNPQQEGGYWLVAGERRWRAAQIAGLQQAPVIVREATSQQLMEWALVENVQRADLNPIEEATAYQTLMGEFGLTQAQVAERVGKSRPAVANLVRLLQLPLAVQRAVVDAQISEGHARLILKLPNSNVQEKFLTEIIARDLSVRATESLINSWLQTRQQAPAAAPHPPKPQQVEEISTIENHFRRALSTQVQLNRNADGSGKLTIHFYSDEDLQGLYQRILGRLEEKGDDNNS
jgi:ParB family chromosome partitioning protein